jgi:hypothetical protein
MKMRGIVEHFVPVIARLEAELEDGNTDPAGWSSRFSPTTPKPPKMAAIGAPPG